MVVSQDNQDSNVSKVHFSSLETNFDRSESKENCAIHILKQKSVYLKKGIHFAYLLSPNNRFL